MQTGTIFSRYSNKRAFLIAECGNNHEGSLDVALELLERAKEAGADAVKFQAGTASGFARCEADVQRYRKYELGQEGYDRLVKRGKELKIPVFFSVWDSEFSYLRDLPFYKIAARQAGDFFLLNDYNRESTIVSIPHTWTLDRVKKMKNYDTTFMHCVTEYPAESAHLEQIDDLRSHLKCLIGYSDHTIGIGACIRAVKLYEAHVIEKHFTLRHDFGPLRDHQLSATPKEMQTLADGIA